MKMRKSSKIIVITVVFLAFISAGCEASSIKSFKPSVDWSRGISIESEASGSVGMIVGGQGERIHLVYSRMTEDGVRIHYTQLDGTGSKVVDVDLALSTVQVRSARIVLAGNEGLHLAWLGRQAGGEDWDLMHVILSTDGSLSSEAIRLSEQGINVGKFAITGTQSGGAAIAWDDRDAGGIFGARVSQFGDWVSRPPLLVKSGRYPALRAGSDGRLHMAWLDADRILYSVFEDERLYAVGGTEIGKTASGTGVVFDGLEIGLSKGWIYAFWSIVNYAGLDAGTSYTEFVAFQPQNLSASLSTPERILIGSSLDQPFSDYRGNLNLTQVVLPGADQINSSFVEQPVSTEGERPELAIALAATINYRRDTHLQIVVALFKAGEFEGYIVASKTASISTDPALAVDAGGNLHTVWREGNAKTDIFYATTSSGAMANLDRVEASDVYNALLVGGMDSAASILLFPIFGLGWMLPGLLIIIVWKRFQDHETLQDAISKIVLLISAILYMSAKVLFLPTILTYLPFSDWIEIPSGWNAPLRLGVPVIIFAIGLIAANWTLRKYQHSTLIFYLALTTTDAILTLAIYGITFLTAG